MRCAKAKKILSDYLDDNLSSQKKMQLEAHLRECSDCHAELAQLQALSSMLQRAGEVEVSEEYWDDYWRRLAVKLPTIKPRPNWRQGLVHIFRKPIPVAYAILAVLLVGLTVFFADVYLDGRQAKSPQMAQAPDNLHYGMGRGAGRAGGATAAAKPQLSLKASEEGRKNAPTTEGIDRFDLKADGLVKDKEMAAKRGELAGKLADSREVGYEVTKPEQPLRRSTPQAGDRVRERAPRSEANLRAITEGEALRELAEAKEPVAASQPETSAREKFTSAMDEDMATNSSAKARKSLSETSQLASADTPAIKEDAAQKRDFSFAEELKYKRKSARGVELRGRAELDLVDSLGKKYPHPYGLIIRVLKVHPADAKLNVKVAKGTDSDSLFLPQLRKANAKVNLEAVLSSRTVTLAGKETSLEFKGGTGDYAFKLNILPPSDKQKEHRLSYLKKYSALKPGETVMFDIPTADADKKNFVVLVTRYKP